MTRALSVLVSVLILLGVGWFFGQRPIGGLKDQLEEQTTQFQTTKTELETALRVAEARGSLWSAHAELLLAAHDVGKRNFGTASERVEAAHDKITRAAAVPGMILPLDGVQSLLESARVSLQQPDTGTQELLNRAATELNHVLSRLGQA